MKCPQCGFVSSNKRDLCPRCSLDLRSYKRALGIPVSNPTLSINELQAKEGPSSSSARSAAATTPSSASPPKGGRQPETRQHRSNDQPCAKQAKKSRTGGGFLRSIFGKRELPTRGQTAETHPPPSPDVPQPPLTLPRGGGVNRDNVRDPQVLTLTPQDTERRMFKPVVESTRDRYLLAVEPSEVETPPAAPIIAEILDPQIQSGEGILQEADQPKFRDLMQALEAEPPSDALIDGDMNEYTHFPGGLGTIDFSDPLNFEKLVEQLDTGEDYAGSSRIDVRSAEEPYMREEVDLERVDDLPELTLPELPDWEELECQPPGASLTGAITNETRSIDRSREERSRGQNEFDSEPVKARGEAYPSVAPPVLEFNDDESLLEQLDAILDGTELDVTAVKEERPTREPPSETGNDDLDVSFEISLDDELEDEDASLSICDRELTGERGSQTPENTKPSPGGDSFGDSLMPRLPTVEPVAVPFQAERNCEDRPFVAGTPPLPVSTLLRGSLTDDLELVKQLLKMVAETYGVSETDILLQLSREDSPDRFSPEQNERHHVFTRAVPLPGPAPINEEVEEEQCPRNEQPEHEERLNEEYRLDELTDLGAEFNLSRLLSEVPTGAIPDSAPDVAEETQTLADEGEIRQNVAALIEGNGFELRSDDAEGEALRAIYDVADERGTLLEGNRRVQEEIEGEGEFDLGSQWTEENPPEKTAPTGWGSVHERDQVTDREWGEGDDRRETTLPTLSGGVPVNVGGESPVVEGESEFECVPARDDEALARQFQPIPEGGELVVRDVSGSEHLPPSEDLKKKAPRLDAEDEQSDGNESAGATVADDLPRLAQVSAAIWDSIDCELRSSAVKEVEIDIGEVIVRRPTETLNVYFAVVEDELRDPSRRRTYETEVVSEKRRIDSRDLENALEEFKRDTKVVATRSERGEAKQSFGISPGEDRIPAYLRPVALPIRIGAGIIDWAVSIVVGGVLGSLVLLPSSTRSELISLRPDPLELAIVLPEVVAVVICCWVVQTSLAVAGRGQTLGQRLFRMSVTDLRGDPVGFADALLWVLLQFTTLLTAGLGLLPGLFRTRRTLHDRLAGCLVARFDPRTFFETLALSPVPETDGENEGESSTVSPDSLC